MGWDCERTKTKGTGNGRGEVGKVKLVGLGGKSYGAHSCACCEIWCWLESCAASVSSCVS